MKKKLSAFILFIVPLLVIAQAIQIEHQQPVDFNDETVLEVNVIQNFENIDKVYLYLKELNDVDFKEIEIDETSFMGERISYVLPMIDSPSISYYFKFELKDGSQQTLPAENPILNTFTLQKVKTQSTSKGFVLLSPDDDTFFANEEVVISVSYFSLADEIEKSSLKLMVNGRDVTAKATVTDNLILYKTKFQRASSVNYYLVANTKNGKQLKSPLWKTNISKIKLLELPFDYYGDVSFVSGMESISADNSATVSEEDDKFAKTMLDLTIRKNWFKFNTDLYFTSRNSTKKQPLNRYTFTFDVPHLKVALGDYNVPMSSFTFRNYKINGFYSNLYFKYFRFKTAVGNSKIDIENDFSPTFKRNAIAFRTEFGSEKFLNWNMTLSKVKDDIDSVDNPENTDAADNIVAATDMMMRFWKNRITIGAEAAVSLYNSRINDGVMSEEDLEDYDMDLDVDLEEFEDIIVINKYLEPFGVSKANIAYTTYLKFYYKKNLLNFSYSEVGPSFNSLGASSLQKDARTISVYDAFSFFRNQIFVSAGLNLTTDNLVDNKETTTTSQNIFSNLSFRFSNMPAFGFSYNSSNLNNDAEDDSPLFMEQKTNIYNFNIGYNVEQISYAPTYFSMGISSFDSEYNYNVAENQETSILGENMNISFSAKSKFRDFPLQTTLSVNTQNKTDDDKSFTFDFNSNYLLLDEKLKPFVGFKITNYEEEDVQGEVNKSSRTYFNLGTGYRFFRETYLSTSFFMINYNENDIDDANYSNLGWDAKITYRF